MVKEINARFTLTSVEKVRIGKECSVHEWLKEGYKSLIQSIESTSFEEICSLGESTALRLLWAREEAARFRLTTPVPGFHIKEEA